jgi:hypothetical protein
MTCDERHESEISIKADWFSARLLKGHLMMICCQLRDYMMPLYVPWNSRNGYKTATIMNEMIPKNHTQESAGTVKNSAMNKKF